MQRNIAQATRKLQEIQESCATINENLKWLGQQTKEGTPAQVFINLGLQALEKVTLFAPAAVKDYLLEEPGNTEELITFTKAEGIQGKHNYKFLPSHQMATV